jgi:hypothetical protein
MTPYRILLKIPVLGTLIYIANCYAFAGDVNAIRKLAGLRAWIRVLFKPILVALILTAGICWPLIWKLFSERHFCFEALSPFAKTPGDMIVSIVPSLLGFGIGVYALVFALAPTFVRDFQRVIDRAKELKPKRFGSALRINSDLAYPLTVLVLTLGVGVYQKGYPTGWLTLVAWVAFWYSIVVMVEMIGVLFGLGDTSLLDKLNPGEPPDPGLGLRTLRRSISAGGRVAPRRGRLGQGQGRGRSPE